VRSFSGKRIKPNRNLKRAEDDNRLLNVASDPRLQVGATGKGSILRDCGGAEREDC
jgi:hypothetical protein